MFWSSIGITLNQVFRSGVNTLGKKEEDTPM